MNKVELIGNNDILWSVEMDDMSFKKWKKDSPAISRHGVIIRSNGEEVVIGVIGGLLICSIVLNVIQFVS